MSYKCPSCVGGLVPLTGEVCHNCGGTAELFDNDTPMDDEKKEVETPEVETEEETTEPVEETPE